MITSILTAALLLQTPAPPPAPTPAPATQAQRAPDTVEGKRPIPPQPEGPQLSEIERLRVENYVLRLQSLEAEMTRQRVALDAAIAEAHPGYRWDWQAGALVAVEAPVTGGKEP